MILSSFCPLDDDDNDEDGVEDIDPLSDDFYPDDNLPSLRRILNYYTSESNENRFVVCVCVCVCVCVW